MNLIDEIGPGITSLDYVRSQLGMARPVSVKDMLARYREPIVIDEPLVTPDGVALGGHHTLTLERSGHFRHEGHMTASGFPSFSYSVRTVIQGRSGTPVIAGADGRAHGDNEFGDDTSRWDESGENPAVSLYWASLKGATHNTDVNFESDFFGTLGDVAVFVGTLAGGFAVAGSVGVCCVLGVHAADALGLDEDVSTAGLVGVAVAGGVLVVFGPSAIIPAIVAGAAAGVAVELTLRHRRLTDRPAEVAFANRVFQGTLPVDRIVLTNMLGFGRRPFTIPSVGDTILVNLGAGFDDPIHYDGKGDADDPDADRKRQRPGQLFIHELTHAWQIDTSSFLPGLMCDALLNQSTTIGGNMDVYKYGNPGPDFASFNPEQQASIVDEWFGGNGPRQRENGPLNDESPYFRYIRDNIRKRIL